MMEKMTVLNWLEMYAEAGYTETSRWLQSKEITKPEEAGFKVDRLRQTRRYEFYCKIDWKQPNTDAPKGYIAQNMLEISQKAISAQS